MAVLTWTGHPLVDVGIATICAMVNKVNPEEITLEDLDRAADEMAEYYFSGIMTSYNSCVFTMNAYDNPTASEDKKQEYENRVLRAHRYGGDPGAGSYRCPFSGLPATHLIERRQMPMLTGEGVINFYPASRDGLPIAGPYLTALQALPLGGRRVEGRLLIAHSDLPAMTLAFARRYLEDNRRLIALAKADNLPTGEGPFPELDREHGAWDAQKKRPKYPDAKAPGTLVAADLMEICQRAQGTRYRDVPFSVTVYWLSNSGQGPTLEVFYLPSQLVRFLFLVMQAPYGRRWQSLVAKGWQEMQAKRSSKGKKGKTEEIRLPGGPGRSRNDVLNDLFTVYENGFIDLQAAGRFIRRHLLKVDWDLTALFLKEVMGVDGRFVEAVKQFADRLADYIDRTNDKPFFRSLVYACGPRELRGALVRAQRNQARARNELLFGLQDYLDIFEADEAIGRSDWSLVRDLVSIRLVEELYKRGFFAREDNKELLVDEEEVALEG